MTKEIKAYKQYIAAELLVQHAPEQWTELAEELLVKISFFQHERLIHLIVTMTFCIMTLLSLLGGFLNPMFFALAALFLALTIPYIFHYYFLENSVQQLYKSYDEIVKRGNKL